MTRPKLGRPKLTRQAIDGRIGRALQQDPTGVEPGRRAQLADALRVVLAALEREERQIEGRAERELTANRMRQTRCRRAIARWGQG